jgi:transcriptional regulator with XRE-family HTH domain
MTAPATAPSPRVSNQELGELIGLSHSSVSRLRSGERGTSVEVMLKIERLLQWDLHDQIKRRDDGTYADKLERLLTEWKRQTR